MKEVIAALIVIVLTVAVIIGKVWPVGSVVTSSIKGISGNCTQTYRVESVFTGDWFCPVVK